MQPFPVQITPDKAMQELLEYNAKVIKGIQALNQLEEDEIQVGFSEKEADVYMKLNELGPTPASTLARLTNIKSPI